MKFLFESEDSIIGITVGIVLIGMSGLYFSLPKFAYDNFVWGLLFAASLVFTLLDVKHTFSDIGGHHKLMLLLLLLNNAVDFIVELAMAGKMFAINIPYVTSFMNPYISNPTMLLYIGIFFVASSVFWLIEFARTK